MDVLFLCALILHSRSQFPLLLSVSCSLPKGSIGLWHEKHPQKIHFEPGRYLIELWGADGGIGCQDGKLLSPGGIGAFVSSEITVKIPIDFFFYIGSKGSVAICDGNHYASGGWNGGGRGGRDSGGGSTGWDSDDSSGGGGGASDLRLLGSDEWNEEESLKSRILVAAGGSGSMFWFHGSPGGELTGFYTSKYPSTFIESTTNQTHGNALGKGADGIDYPKVPSSGAGGGYFGGFPGTPNQENYGNVSSSGSSFAMGFPGCQEISDEISSAINISNQVLIAGHRSYRPSSPSNGDGFGLIQTLGLFNSHRKIMCRIKITIMCSFYIMVL